MTRLLPLLLAASLLSSPAFAGGISFDLPRLTFSSPKAVVTQSSAGPQSPDTKPPVAASSHD